MEIFTKEVLEDDNKSGLGLPADAIKPFDAILVSGLGEGGWQKVSMPIKGSPSVLDNRLTISAPLPRCLSPFVLDNRLAFSGPLILGGLPTIEHQNAEDHQIDEKMRRLTYEGSDTEASIISEESDIETYTDTINTNEERVSERKSNETSQKVIFWRTIAIITFILDIVSTVTDQLSSIHKPNLALVGMVASATTVVLTVSEFIYRICNDGVQLERRGLLPWWYYVSGDRRRFGSQDDIIGWLSAMSQCITAKVNYAFIIYRHRPPITVQISVIVSSFGFLWSKFKVEAEQTNIDQSSREETVDR